MALDTQDTHTFKTFPEFSRLTLKDRRRYESLIKDFPPISDLSFATIMMWWNALDSAAVSLLNGNLVLSYWWPGMEDATGLSLVGTNKVDESICAIFDYLRQRGEPVKLVNVPEMVVQHIEYPELFDIKAEHTFDEYIIPVEANYPLSRLPLFRRRRIKSFLKQVPEDDIIVRLIDLDDAKMQSLLLSKAEEWKGRGVLNQLYSLQGESLHYGIRHATLIGLECVGMFVKGELYGYCLYQRPHDKRYIIINHARVYPDLPRTLDYMIYAFAGWFAERGVQFANVERDTNLPALRMLKLAMGPENFFRKYTIKPAE